MAEVERTRGIRRGPFQPPEVPAQPENTGLDELELALVDLVRVALTGDGTGVRQLAKRLLRKPPATLQERPAFKRALALTLSQTETPSLPLREGRGADPWSAYTGPVRTERRLQPVASTPEADLALDLQLATEDEPLLPAKCQRRLEMLAAEYKSQRLQAAGVDPTRTVLLLGPPGVGKTLSASWLAHTLGRPLLRLDLATLISAELGSSGKALRAAFRAAASRGAVLFLDELDALARTRGEGQDVGEARRLVNILLLEIDAWPSGGLLIGATNHHDLLDPAVRRRFDITLELPLPDLATRRRLLERVLCAGADDERIGSAISAAAESTAGKSHSDVVRIARRALRDALASETQRSEALLQAVWDDSEHDQETRDGVAYAMRETLGLTDREIARRLEVTHPTVAAGIGRHIARAAGREPAGPSL